MNFLKDRIKKWGNINLFSYHGPLFSKGDVLVVGSRNLEEAISILIYMYLSNLVDNEYGIDSLIENLGSLIDLETFLRNQISVHIEKGYPANPGLESELVTHLNRLIRDNTN